MTSRRFWVLAAAAALAVGVLALLPRGASEADPACAVRSFEGSNFIVCAYDARRHQLRLASRDANSAYLRSFRALETDLGVDAARVRFAMNAGMFNDAGAPIGLYVEDGELRHDIRLADGPGNFHLKPNGVFSQDEDGAVRVETSEAFVARDAPPRWATQSGPMLVIDGRLHPSFEADGQSRVVRNGVGVRDRNTAYFVISRGPVSFGRFARFFRDELGCANALFLDGAVSSLWAPNLRRQDRRDELGPLVVVLERAR